MRSSRSSLKVLKRHLEGEMRPVRKLAVISYDEISVEPSITYDQREDRILPSANKCQVVMVRGLLRGFRLPVYIAFNQVMTKEILFDVIKACEEQGAEIVATVSDMVC